MIPKNSEIRANADMRALARMIARVRPMTAPPPRRGRGVPQRIEGKGNFLVQNPPKSIQRPTEAGMQLARGKRAAMVAQDGLLPTPGLDQRKMLQPANRKP